MDGGRLLSERRARAQGGPPLGLESNEGPGHMCGTPDSVASPPVKEPHTGLPQGRMPGAPRKAGRDRAEHPHGLAPKREAAGPSGPAREEAS